MPLKYKPCPCETCILYCKCTTIVQISEDNLYTHIIPFCSPIRKYLWVTDYSNYGFVYGGYRKEFQPEAKSRYFKFLEMLKRPIAYSL